MAVSDIPNYLQGFIFSDASASYWDSGNSKFLDQAGYGGYNDLFITAGTPTFDTLNSQKGIILDNTCQGKFILPIQWEGALITVMRPIMSSNATLYPVIQGQASTVTSNATVRMVRSTGSNYNHRIVTATVTLVCVATYTTGTPSDAKVVAYSTSQQTRKGYVTDDGITVTESGPVSASDTGDLCGMSGGRLTTENGMWARFGNISGVKGSVAVSTNTMAMYEMHFFKGNPLVDNATEVQAVIAELKTKYGI